MANFNLISHLQSHAFLFNQHEQMREGDLHFYFSMLDLQFLDKETEVIMTALLQRLREATFYKVANGTRKNKQGNTVQKFTNRQIDLSQEIVAEAIHLKGPEGEDTMPHIHFILKKEARLGRNYSLLKKHIIAITSEFELSPHFDEMVEHDMGKVKNLANAVKSISWSWKKMNNATLKKTIQNKPYITNTLKLLRDYTLKTNNLTYYIKTLDGLKKRLNRLKLDLYHDSHNLRHTYPIPLTDKDLQVVQLIQERNFSQENMRPFINTPLLRDFIRYSAGTSTSYLINALKEQTTLLDGIYKNQIAVKNYITLTQKNPTIKKSQQTPIKKVAIKQNRDDRKNFIEVAALSTNEKSLREGMTSKGYQSFSFKKRSGKVIGFSYLKDEKKHIHSFTNLGINWSNIKQQLMKNMKHKDFPKINETTSHSIHQNEPKKNHPNLDIPDTIDINYKSDDVKKRKEKESLRARIKRIKDGPDKELKKAVEQATKYANKLIQKLVGGIQEFKQNISILGARIQEFRAKSGHLEKDIRTEEDAHTRIKYEIKTTETKCDGFRESIASTKRLKLNFSNFDHEDAPNVISAEDIYSANEIYNDITLILNSIEKINQEIMLLGNKNTPTTHIKPQHTYPTDEIFDLWRNLLQKEHDLRLTRSSLEFEMPTAKIKPQEAPLKNKKISNFLKP